ncbi:LysE family translocator [Endothiovibrio diazotrophicus]
MNIEFLVTSLIVVLLPGTGVLYTLSVGLTRGTRASLFAALGCTAGILPHLLASVLGLAAILHASAVAFQAVKFLGVAYLAYLAWAMWRESGVVELDGRSAERSGAAVALRAFLINILNPKLSIFFLAFLPQFVPAGTASPLGHMLLLGALFMAMTLVVFALYGVVADRVRHHLAHSPGPVRWIQRAFSGVFVALAARLAVTDR